MHHQPAILSPVPNSARFIVAGLRPGASPLTCLERISSLELTPGIVLGLGSPLVFDRGAAGVPTGVEGLRPFPALSGPAVSYPSTQGALWAFVSGDDPGATLLSTRALFRALEPELMIEEEVLSFKYAEGRDLSGYEDGTENPQGEKAELAALVADPTEGLTGSSFVAVQRWVHDLSQLEKMTPEERDHVIGRNRVTNDELADAPASAHVKRTAQESFDPPAFMLRRSMPWGTVREHGLYFVAYGASLDPFERMLTRMAGLEDGITDALARFTRAVSGGYYWCPPVRGNRLDLRAVLRR